MNGREHQCDLAEYLAIKAESSGRINDYLDHGPTFYRAKHIDGQIEDEQTDAMMLGSAIHCELLEPMHYLARYIVGPCEDRRSKKWGDFVKEHVGLDVLKPSQQETVACVASAVRRHDEARFLLGADDGVSECTVLWTDDATGIDCKARFDRTLRMKSWAVEFKSTRDVRPEELSRAAYNGGWHRRQAFYTEGYRQAFGSAPLAFPFIAASTVAPYEVTVFRLNADAEQLGHADVRRALDGIAAMRESNDWRAPWQVGLAELSLPQWAVKRDMEAAQ